MPVLDIVAATAVKRTPRVMQLEGFFDLPPTQRQESRWQVNLPVEDFAWNVGLIVGPSGSGKSTLAREAFGKSLVSGFDWPEDESVVDGFPKDAGIKDITAALSSVGFSSPPSWLRPFRCLSNGEQFRATLARAMIESPDLAVVDEFTSVVDRTVAQIGSAAVSKAVRRASKRLVAVTCHYDVEEWLQPDWVLEMPRGTFTRRSLRRRPEIKLEVRRVGRPAWELFARHHYLSGSLSTQAKCFVAFLDGTPVAFSSAYVQPHAKPYWREHRTVCLPDYQGVGIGNVLAEIVASACVATGKRYTSVTGNPAMIAYRARSRDWLMVRGPSMAKPDASRTKLNLMWKKRRATTRMTASFRYVGKPRA